MYTGKRKYDAISSDTPECGSNSSSSRRDYEVFLSFRGEDTRTNFTDHLYNALLDKGIHTFRDNEELRTGEKIGPALLCAIHQSKIAIPIFSKDYASRKWCLLELAEIAECMKLEKMRVMPVFYHVDPSHVRNQTPGSSYGNAFHEHQKKFNEETVEVWKKALKEVGELKGRDLKNTADGHEGKFIKLIVNEVWSELRKSPLTISDNVVGIHSHIKEMMKLLNIASKDRRIVGIHGLGGIGKTTIARCVYNTVYHHFEGCSFIADFRETFRTKGAVHLQSQLLTNILNIENPSITSVDQGIDMIKRRLSSKKVLIVLDDVDKNREIDAIIGKRDWFGVGSRFIITTRDEHVLKLLQVDGTYEPIEMDSDQSLKLFSRNAFKIDHPPEDYLDLSKDVVKKAGGLPLALEVIGSSLYLKTEPVWKDTVEKLAKIPNYEVLMKLRISYDGLDDMEKAIFLDLACFFIGMHKRIACYIWDGYKFCPEAGIESLRSKSLVKVDEENKLKMHDQLRDLGREIVRQENPKDLGKRSRLWFDEEVDEEVLEVLSTQQGTREVEGLCITSPYGFRYKFLNQRNKYKFLCQQNNQCMIESFADMTKLRLLQMDYAVVAGNLMHSFPEMRWLSWKRCPMQFTPTNLKRLCVLDLSESDITETWMGWNYIKEAKFLKFLNLSRCDKLTRTPNFSENTQLEELILQGCTNLATLDSSIGHLKKLVILNMNECYSLMHLPASIGELTSLQILDIRHVDIDQLPETFSHLEALTELYVDFSAIRLPSSICHLRDLKILSNFHYSMKFEGMTTTKGFPDKPRMESEMDLPDLPSSLKYLHASKCLMRSLPMLSNLTNLGVLQLDDCPNLMDIPTAINALTRLESLGFEKCPHLQCIPNLPSSLKSLKVHNCENLGEISGYSDMGNLEILRLHNCSRLAKVSLEGLHSLQQFEIWNCDSLRKLPKLRGWKRLRCLDFSRVGLSEMEVLEGLYSLEKLRITSCELSRIILNLSDSKNLKCIEIQGCNELSAIEGLKGLDSLEKLSMSNCPSLRRIQLPKKLCELDIRKCGNLSEIEGPEDLESSTKIFLWGCKSIRLPDLSNFKMLKDLTILDPPLENRFEGLESLKEYCFEALEYCFEALKSSEEYCFEGLESLEKLSLSRFNLQVKQCKSVKIFPDFSKLTKLQVLKIKYCEKVTVIQGVDGLKNLVELRIVECNSIETLPCLSNLKKLKILEASCCKKLIEIQGMDELESLEHLIIEDCISIETLPCLSKLKKLKSLYVYGCKKLTEIQGVNELESLKSFTVRGCKSLQLPDFSSFKSKKLEPSCLRIE